MKYIRTELIGVVIFSRIRKHDEMARRMMSTNDKIISAGFVRYDRFLKDSEKVMVFGESVSLGVGVAEDDQDLIRMLLDQ